jgi:hypothetical protein
MRRAQRITASGRVRVSASNFSEKIKYQVNPKTKSHQWPKISAARRRRQEIFP